MNDLSKGSVKKQLLIFSVPFLLGMVLQSLMNFSDLMFVSHFSTNDGSVAGVGVGNQLCYLVINAVVGLSVGGSILISQAYGAKDNEKVKMTASTMLIWLFILSVIISISVIFGAKSILRLLKTPENALNEGYSYVFITMLGVPFIFIYNGISAILRGLGDTKNPLLFIFIAAVLNAGFDAVAVVVLKKGAGGVAFSTVLAQGIACMISFIYMLKKAKELLGERPKVQFAWERSKEIFKIGIPTAIQNIAASLSFLFLNYVIAVACAEDSVSALSASSMVFKLNAFAILPARSFSMAVASMVGQNKGANQNKRIKQTFFSSIIFTLLIGICLTLLSIFLTKPILSVFKPNAKIIEYGVPYMRFLALDYIFLPFAVSMFGLADGLKKTHISMWVNALTSLVGRLPFAYLFGVIFKLGMKGIGIAIPMSTLISAVIMLIYIKSKLWRTLE